MARREQLQLLADWSNRVDDQRKRSKNRVEKKAAEKAVTGPSPEDTIFESFRQLEKDGYSNVSLEALQHSFKGEHLIAPLVTSWCPSPPHCIGFLGLFFSQFFFSIFSKNTNFSRSS